MYLLRVLLLFNELFSFFRNANLKMGSTFKTSRRLENVTSDVRFLEECMGKNIVPKGLGWKLQLQGLDEEVEDKVRRIKEDAISRVMDVMVKGMRRKKEMLEDKLEKEVEKVVAGRAGWEVVWEMEKIDEHKRKCKEEASRRKMGKMKKLQAQKGPLREERVPEAKGGRQEFVRRWRRKRRGRKEKQQLNLGRCWGKKGGRG